MNRLADPVKLFCMGVYNSSMGMPDLPPKRPVGRPRAFDRDTALAIAMDLFWRHGFEGTSTAQLTAAMGISQPSLYGTFGSKEALYREAVGLYLARFGLDRFLRQPQVSGLSTRGAIEAMLLDAARRYADSASHPPGCMVATAGLQGGAAHPEVCEEMAFVRKQAQQAIRQRLLAGLKAGELPMATDIETLSAYFAMIIQGMAVQARDGARHSLLKRLAKLAMKAWPE